MEYVFCLIKISETIRKSIKAKDTYQLVFDREAKTAEDYIDNKTICSYRLKHQIMVICHCSQKKPPTIPKPVWHSPWKLSRVISGRMGWVRCISVEPGNKLFVTGAGDRVIKIWDLASGRLKLSLTGHVSKHLYLFSCGEDRPVKCWDLEYNKVIWHFHGHLLAVCSLALHPTIDVLATGGCDSTARIWDMRTKANIHVLSGDTNTVASVVLQAGNSQIITGSHDSTARVWDLAAGKSVFTLTNHKKFVLSVVLHPTLYMLGSASPDNIKQWRCPEGNFIQNITGHNAIVNCMAANPDGVLVSGGDNGTMFFWDWRTGYNFQRFQLKLTCPTWFHEQ